MVKALLRYSTKTHHDQLGHDTALRSDSTVRPGRGVLGSR